MPNLRLMLTMVDTDTVDITVVDMDTDILWDTGDTDMVDSTDTVDTTTVRLQLN